MIGQDVTKTWRRLGDRVARLAGQASGHDWQARYREAVRRRGTARVLAQHPRAALLDRDFSIGAYLERNPDVADAVSSAGEAAFHYLEFGEAEGRVARPERWDPAFVRRYHGLTLPETASARQACALLRRAGVAAQDALLEESHLWQVNGLFGAVFAKIFEHEYYAVAAEAAGVPLSSGDRLSAIAHFCETGLPRGVPPHPDHVFDAAFYRDALAFAEVEAPPEAEEAALLRHWARIGVRAGAHANPRAWFRMRCGVDLPLAILAALPDFHAASADLGPDATLPEVLAQLEDVPIPGASVFDRGAAGVVGFLIDLARQKRRVGEAATAEWLLSRVLDHEPGHPRASLDLADLIHGQNRAGTEIQLRKSVPVGMDGGANRITLAERLVTQGRIREALDVCADLPESLFGDVALRRRRYDLGRAIFAGVWESLSDWIETTPLPDLQALLSDALVLCTPPFRPPERSTPIRRVALLANDDLYQCKLYRGDQKIEQLRAAGYEADLYPLSYDLDRLRSRLDRYDAVIFMRVPAFPRVIDLIAEAAQQGLATFYDCDDLIFDPAVFPPPLPDYAGQITRAEHAAIACGVPLFRHAMGLCDFGIASTPTIRDAMAPIVRSGKAFLHRNALGAVHLRAAESMPRPVQGKDARVVILYATGTKAHKAEFTEILEPALAEILGRHAGRVEIRLVGMFPEFRHLDPAHPDVHLVDPVWDFETYCTEVAAADINLSVLAPSRLTDAKSEIKWMEAAMLGIPSVVSPTATHRDVIEDGVTGFLAADRAGFVGAMSRLVEDPGLRGRVGAAARMRVLSEYGLEAMGRNLDAICTEVRPVLPRPKARLLIVNVFYSPQEIGGATRVVQDNVADLLRLFGDQYEIDVFATLEGGQRPYEVNCHARDGVRVWTVTARDGVADMEVTDPRMADIFETLLDRIAPDLVHLHCIQRLTASVIDPLRRRDIPYLVTLHDGWWISPNQFVTDATGAEELYDFKAPDLPERARITRRGLDGAVARLAVSESFAALHRAAGVEDVETVENGLSELPQVVRVEGPPGRVRLGLIGGASRHKGFSLMRAAIHARRFDSLDLLVVDHALPSGQIREEVWNGTPVTFVPRLPLSRAGEIFARLDVLLALSTWPESYGLVTREALALGLWVVASDRGAIGKNVSEGETGHIVDVSDHSALVDCLARIDADPERYRMPPARRPELRRSQSQAEELHRIYMRLLEPPSEEEV